MGPAPVAELAAAWGSDGVERTGLRLSGQAGKLQYNLGAMRFHTDGYRDHSAARRDSFNGKFSYLLDEDTRVRLILNSMGMPGVQDPLGLTRAEFEADPRQATASAKIFNTRKTVAQQQVGLVLEQRVSRWLRCSSPGASASAKRRSSWLSRRWRRRHRPSPEA